MPEIITLSGLGGRNYDFQLYPLHGTVFYRLPGVYVAMRSGAFGLHIPLYVGQTFDFYDRLISSRLSHEGLSRAIVQGATHIAVLVVRDQGTRLAVETELRHSLQPPCNDQGLGMFG